MSQTEYEGLAAVQRELRPVPWPGRAAQSGGGQSAGIAGSRGPIDTPEKFGQVVSEGRPHRGMPAFKGTLSPDQILASLRIREGSGREEDHSGPAGRAGRIMPTGSESESDDSWHRQHRAP